jgi:hypothetical protein
MLKIMKSFVNTILLVSLFFCVQAQNYEIKAFENLNANAQTETDSLEFERPFNFFLSAGAVWAEKSLLDATVSPIDKTIQFQDKGRINTSISTGIIWNPFKDLNDNKRVLMKNQKPINIQRDLIAVALLIDIFQLNFDQSDLNRTVPLDVGFGIGIRTGDFLALITYELSHFRQPRDYFYNEFKEGNKQLTLPGEDGPTTRIDPTNDNIFYNKLIPSFGIRLGYSFVKKDK